MTCVKVLATIERGEKKSQVSRMFNISRDTIDRWLKRRNSTGVKAAGYQRGHSHRIKDWDAFRAFAKLHGDKTQSEMVRQGELSERTISCFGAHRMDSKKRRTATENAMKTNAPLS